MPFRYGSADCLTWMAPWVLARRGVDPGTGIRETYSTEFGALRIVRKAGGMVPFLDGVFAPLGIVRAAAPRPGDVAVVQGRPDEGEIGGLVLERLVACLARPAGLFLRPTPIIAAWRI